MKLKNIKSYFNKIKYFLWLIFSMLVTLFLLIGHVLNSSIRVDEYTIILLIVIIILPFLKYFKIVSFTVGDTKFTLEKFQNETISNTPYKDPSLPISNLLANKELVFDSNNHQIKEKFTNKVLATKITFIPRGAITIVKSSNVSSITDSGENRFKIHFIESISDDYFVSINGSIEIHGTKLIEKNKNYLEFELHNPIPDIVNVTIILNN